MVLTSIFSFSIKYYKLLTIPYNLAKYFNEDVGLKSQRMNFYEEDNLSALEAKFEAQKLAFAPLAFQATRVLRDSGILAAIEDSGNDGITLDEIIKKVGLSTYGVRVLVEAGLGQRLITWKDDKYRITKTGFFILHDTMTRVNLDFTHDVCYKGAFFLDEAIKNGKPDGLKVFGEWPTVYEALSKLPKEVQKSWFAFDHYYSDMAFPLVLPIVFQDKPKKLLDVGGNTGKWALSCVNYDHDVHVTIADLPGQLAMAAVYVKENGKEDRVSGFPINLLDHTQQFPKGNDAIWMSQFLDCFSEEEIISILKRAAEAIDENGSVYIMETYWDRQKFEAASFSLQQTSLYFTVIANGNSQMYYSKNMIECVHAAGLYVDKDVDYIGVSHTLFRCKKKLK